MRTAIRKMGNSQGILIPKPFLKEIGLVLGEVELQVEKDAIVIRKPKKKLREGWAEAARSIAASSAEQAIAWPLLPKESDTEFSW